MVVINKSPVKRIRFTRDKGGARKDVSRFHANETGSRAVRKEMIHRVDAGSDGTFKP
jgi:hypothetical protein